MDEWRRLSIPSSPVPSSFVPLRSFFFVCARDNRFRGENYIENVDGWMDGRTDAWKEQEKAWKTREKEMRRGDRVENRDAGMRWSGMADDHTHTHTHTHTQSCTLEETISWGGRQRATQRRTPHLFVVYVQAEGRPFKEDPENVKDKGETS